MARFLSTFPRVLLLFSLAACSTYTAAPLDPAELLHGLRQPQPLPLPAEGLTPQVATLTALAHNQDLQVVRHAVGIADSMLLEAGLWPDIKLGWDAMDWVIGGTRDDALAGTSAMMSLFRPDERNALLANAEVASNLVRIQLLEAEWRLTRLVQRQYVFVTETREGLQLAQQASEVAQQTVALLQRGMDVGGATRFDLEMALVQQAENQRQLQMQQRKAELARFQLNALMGIAPNSDYETVPLHALEKTWPLPNVANAEALVDLALLQRPDLRARALDYQRTEAALRLEVSRQWPSLALGTGFSLQLPLFRRFNKVAIDTARLRRDQAGARWQATVAALRNDGWRLLRNAEGQANEWATVRDVMTPALERSLDMSQQAQEMGALSFLEVLFAQHQLISTRREALATHADAIRAQAEVTWFLGATALSTPSDR